MKKERKNFVDTGNDVINSSNNQEPDNQINGIIVDLRQVIDQINIDRKNAENLILEPAKHLDENRLCERKQISRKIKNILGDKIKEGKITGKWIEECLPSEYKRKYTTKSELTSLSEEDKPQEIMVDTGGKIIDEAGQSSLESFKSNLNAKENPRQANAAGYTVEQNQVYECPRCQDLEEALIKATSLTSASNYPLIEEKEFKILKEKQGLVIVAMRNSEHVCYLKFDINDQLLTAEADTSRTKKGFVS
jgi:hypothetical protein